MGAAPGQEDDGLEKGRLAGGVRADDQLRARAKLGVERCVGTKVADREGLNGPRRAHALRMSSEAA